MKIMFVLMIWFVLTGNTEMSLFSRKVHSSKGKSKHLDRRRWLLYYSPYQNLKHGHLKKSKPKFLTSNKEIDMPYRIFRSENEYKHVKSKQIQNHIYAKHPKEMLLKVYNKKRIESPIHQQFLYKRKHLIKRKGNVASAIGDFETENIKANNLAIHDRLFNSKVGTKHTFFSNIRKTKDEFSKNDNYVVHLQNEKRQFSLPLFSGANVNSQSNSFTSSNEKVDNKLISHYSRNLVQKPEGRRQVSRNPKYSTFPAFYNFKKVKAFQDFSVSTEDMNFFTSKLPFRKEVLSEYEQSATNVIISYSTPPSYFGLEIPVKNSIYKNRISFEDKLRTTKSFYDVFPEEKEQITKFPEAFGNSTLKEPSLQELRKYFRRQFFKKRMSNASNSKMYNQLAKDFSLYNKTTSSNSSDMTSSEIPSLQHLYHKLKDVKSISTLVGNNRRAILFVAAVILFTTLILVSRAIYRKRKIRYAFEKNKLTLLRAKNKEKHKLFKTISQLKYDKLEEDIEE